MKNYRTKMFYKCLLYVMRHCFHEKLTTLPWDIYECLHFFSVNPARTQLTSKFKTHMHTHLHDITGTLSFTAPVTTKRSEQATTE